jgi:hypothetical protein
VAVSVAWPQLGRCGSKAGKHRHTKGRKLQPLKCSRFHLGKTSNRWWACHGRATEHASKVTSVHREQAQHEGCQHKHASEGKKELDWSDGSPMGSLTFRSFCRTRRGRGAWMPCWGRKRGSSLSSLQDRGSLGVDVPVNDVVDRRSRRP